MTDLDSGIEKLKITKNKFKDVLEEISLQNSQYQLEVLPKILDNFMNGVISRKRMKITSAWMVNNTSAEEKFQKRREKMPKNTQVSIGFLYTSKWKKIEKIAQSGTVKNHNIKVSHLATATMGVSLCQYADIFDPGYLNTKFPQKGYLLLLKYLKGKVNYVPCDSYPMDPQPNYDCHMAKNVSINKNSSRLNSFHQSQVFIYDYTDDGDVVTCQSKIIPFAAVEFQWIGPHLYGIKDRTMRSTMIREEAPKEDTTKNDIIEQKKKHISSFDILSLNASSVIPFELSIKGFPEIIMKSIAYVYSIDSVISFLRSDQPWEMFGVIENIVFEREFRSLKNYWTNKTRCKVSKDLNPISDDILISSNQTNLLNPSGIAFDLDFSEDLLKIPQFVTYIRVVIVGYEYSKRLTEQFNLTKTMGLINRHGESNMPIFIFPDGEISKKLGIPAIPDVYCFHGLVFHLQHPLFCTLCNSAEIQNEKKIFFSSLTNHRNQIAQLNKTQLSNLINFEVLDQTLQSQIQVQKSFLLKIVKPQSNTSINSYKSICFESSCDDCDCEYHYPIKIMKMNSVPITEGQSIREKNTFGNMSSLNSKQIDIYPVYDYLNQSFHQDTNYEVRNFTDSDLNGSSNYTRSVNLKQQKSKGSFFSMNFLTYCKAGYSDLRGYKVKTFQTPTSKNFCTINKKLTKKMWSFDQDHFKPIINSPGASAYE